MPCACVSIYIARMRDFCIVLLGGEVFCRARQCIMHSDIKHVTFGLQQRAVSNKFQHQIRQWYTTHYTKHLNDPLSKLRKKHISDIRIYSE